MQGYQEARDSVPSTFDEMMTNFGKRLEIRALRESVEQNAQ
jgi:hypothetical protein